MGWIVTTLIVAFWDPWKTLVYALDVMFALNIWRWSWQKFLDIGGEMAYILSKKKKISLETYGTLNLVPAAGWRM